MKSLTVHVGKGYPIYIENNILTNAGALIRTVTNAQKVCLVSDTTVFSLYGEPLLSVLTDAGFTVFPYVLEGGEAVKTPATALKLVTYMAENELTRNDLAVALGGGVVGDITGFAAAVYLRGIDYVQLPTSLLAQVDASVGGKTAVNLPQGKNLCGAFHQPVLVLIDPAVLQTLPPRHYADGMAEAIKMGAVMHKGLFEAIEAGNADGKMEDIIFDCVRLKAAVVERDEREQGERALLNFGHTLGHAIEKLHDFQTISHGEAVGIGMVMVCRAAERNGLTEPGTADRIVAVLRRYGLPTTHEINIETILKAMRNDKKRTGDTFRLVIIQSIGKGMVYSIADDAVKAFFGVVS